jgi:hypothetical protein
VLRREIRRRASAAAAARLGAAAVVAATVTFGAGAARAGDSDAADELIARGIELREHGKDDEALGVFKQALAKAPGSPRARAQVALAEQALGMWVAADADLAQALEARSDPWIAKNEAALEGALAVIRRHVGSLEVRGPDGAEIFLDGVRVGTLPQSAPLRAEAGRRSLAVRAKGFHATERAIEVPPNGVARETVTLEPLPADRAGGGAGAGGGSGDAGRLGGAGDGSGQRLLGWVFAGTGGALLLGGGAGLLVRQGYISDYNDQCPGLGVNQPPSCDDKVESSRTWMTISLVGLIAGGAFAVGGVALVLTAPSPASATSATSATSVTRASRPDGSGLRVVCAPSLAGAACQGTF